MLDNRVSTIELNLITCWRILWKYRAMIIVILMLASVAAVVSSLLMTKYYKAHAVMIPVSSKSSMGGLSSLVSQFGGLASLAGITSGGPGKVEKIMAILNSRTVAENIIKRENLMPILFKDKWDEKEGRWKSDDPSFQPKMEKAVKKLKGTVFVMFHKKKKTIKISSVFDSPELAARVVNAYIYELQEFINDNSFTIAKRNRIFIEKQLEENKIEYLVAGKEINAFYKAKGISSTEADLDVNVSLNSDAEVSIDDMPKLAALKDGRNPALSNLISQKAQVENKLEVVKTVKNVPQQVYLNYLLLRREVLAKVNALLSSQFEMAKINETKEQLAFEVIDYAVPPIMRFKPQRARICITTFIIAFMFSILLAFGREYLKRLRAHVDPDRNSQHDMAWLNK